jgi:PAS domain S-box-containing protein
MSLDDILQSLLSAADGVFVIDGEQRIIHWNPAAQQLLGYARDEVIGRDCWEILDADDGGVAAGASGNRRATAAALAGTPVANYDTCVRTRSGKPHWINLSLLTLITSKNQETWLAAVLFRDATQKKLNEQCVAQVHEAVSRLQNGLLPPSCFRDSVTSPGGSLTGREREVLILLARGLNTGDIAYALSVSPATIRNHIQSILTKLHVHSRLEAVAYAMERGLVGAGGRSG